ncbi:MAG: osmoprotectant transport system substrate-binding protein [Actinomycetota bacterium]|jgi:osmoprotectant transport system substrate-binding protein|nr:osmoprotectant transport system substrate-binding protein [Actinomycetota bacterium]
MRIFRRSVLGATLVAFVVLATACASGGDNNTKGAAGSSSGTKPSLTVGVSAAFPENQIVAEMYAQVLENAGYKVTTQEDIQSREVSDPALDSGKIDIKPEYLASELLFLDPNAKASGDPQNNADLLKPLLAQKGLDLLTPSAAQDQNAFVTTSDLASKDNLSTVSDLASVASGLTLGGPPECPKRPYCAIGLKKTYGVTFGDFKALSSGTLVAQALQSGDIDVGLLFSTDPTISADNFVLLQDDKGLQSAENITPVVRHDVDTSEVADLLNGVSATLTTDNITGLIAKVALQHQDPAAVAKLFLQDNGLL